MKEINVAGQKRVDLGKKASKELRKQGFVPCNLYGEKKNDKGTPEALSFALPFSELRKLIYTPHIYVINLEIEGSHHTAILKEVQFHPVTDRILHVDFYQLSADKAVVMEVPVKITGRAKGVVAGGVLRQSFRKLKLKAIPANLPDEIVVDVTPLRIGNKIYVGDIKNDAYTFLHPDNAVIAAVKMSRNAMKNAGAMQEDDED